MVVLSADRPVLRDGVLGARNRIGLTSRTSPIPVSSDDGIASVSYFHVLMPDRLFRLAPALVSRPVARSDQPSDRSSSAAP